MRRTGMMSRLLLAAAVLAFGPAGAGGGQLHVIDNGLIRVEVDPDLFAVRFVGRPGGANLVAPLHVSERLRSRPGADPGGIAVHCQIDGAQDMLARGPADIIESTPHRLVLLGPPLDKALRVRMEISTVEAASEAAFAISIQTTDEQPRQVRLSTISMLAPDAELRLAVADVTIRPAWPGAAPLGDAWWELPATTEGTASIDLPAPQFAVHSQGAEWLRQVEHADSQSLVVRYETDAVQRRNAVRVEAPSAPADLWNQPALRETWRIRLAGE